MCVLVYLRISKGREKMQNFNIHNNILVKLTDEGLRILDSKRKEYLDKVPSEAKDDINKYFEQFQPNEEGYTQMSFLDLMHYFGGSYSFNNCFDANIKISIDKSIEQTMSESEDIDESVKNIH